MLSRSLNQAAMRVGQLVAEVRELVEGLDHRLSLIDRESMQLLESRGNVTDLHPFMITYL